MLIQESGHQPQLTGCFQSPDRHQNTQEEKDRRQVDVRKQLGDTQLVGFVHMQPTVYNIRIEPQNHQPQQDAQERREVCQHLKDRNQSQ